MSFFRYPGGKAKVRDTIYSHIEPYSAIPGIEYREPFWGGGSVGLNFFYNHPEWESVWINDKDIGIACLWNSLIWHPEDLKDLVMSFTPSIRHFDNYKEELLNLEELPCDRPGIVECGFKKLAIHQISYSGLGTKSGGPLGGREQKSKYKIDCRWSPERICKKIDRIHKRMFSLSYRDLECTNYDFSTLINTDGEAIIYLDPPYYIKGKDLYQHSFTEDDHYRLADCLNHTDHHWILSYDDCEEIRDLYDWAIVTTIDINYSITAATNKKTGEKESRYKTELLIYPEHHIEVRDEYLLSK